VTAGIAAAHANALLNLYRGTTVTGITLWVKLHVGDPGSAGTANASAVTTRQSLSFGVAASGSISLSAAPTAWSMTATENLTHVSFWDASTAGNFVRSAPLTTSKAVANLDTFTLATCSFGYTPLAA